MAIFSHLDNCIVLGLNRDCQDHYLPTMKIKHTFRVILWGLLFLSGWEVSKASHMMGVDLTYECINNCTIRVHLRAYRDCSGVSGITNTITFNPTTPGCGQPTPVTAWSAQQTTQVTPICPGFTTRCTNASATINGVEEYYWFRDYNICNVPNCTYTISWGSCCRNGAISSIGAPASANMYINATTLNTGITPCNSSPEFINPPVPYICAGQPFIFNQGATDPEGDSLSYALGPCMTSTTGTPVSYLGGFTPQQPLGPSWNVSINPVTGDVTVFPQPGNLVVGVMCVYVSEWRNGVVINTIVRDIQMTVINCPNNNLPSVPNLTQPVNGQINGFTVSTCVNNPLCFNIPSVDPNNTQIVTMTWSQNLPGATFTQVGNPAVQNTIVGTAGNPPQAQFCWTPTAVGNYSFQVTVRDNACPIIGTSQFTIQINVTNLQSNIVANNLGCGEVSLCAVPLLGTGPFTFQWSGPGGLTNNPNAGDSCLTHIYPATGTYDYFVQIADPNGCVGFDTGQVSVVINVQAQAGPDFRICTSGSGTLGTPARPNYTYSWSPTTGLSNPTAAQPTFNLTNNGTTPLVVPYVVTATDQTTGCINRDTAVVTIWPSLQASTVSAATTCFGGNDGTATVQPSGGTGNYTYAWSAAAGGQTTVTATNLSAGSYNVTVTDSVGCSVVSSVVVQQPAPATVSVSMNPVSCFGGSDGSATAVASGGTSPYTYNWLPGNQAGAVVGGLSAGTYTVEVSDDNGCETSATVTVTEPTLLQATATATPTSCALPLPNGTAAALPTGGTPPYSFAWNSAPIQTTAYATGLDVGVYTVTVTDDNGCVTTASATVGSIPPPSVVAGPDVSACEGAGGTGITATPSAGTPGYWFTWWCQNGNCGLSNVHSPNPVANPNISQYYYVQVTDTNGCVSNVDSLWFEILPKPVVDAGPDMIICGDSAPCVVLTPNVSNAPGPYTYQWFPAAGLNDATLQNPCARPDTTTAYTLIVSSGNGCTSDFTTTDTVSTAIVFVNPVPVASAGPDRDICLGDSAMLEGIGLGAGPAYDFEWSPSSGVSNVSLPNPLVSPAATTVYTLTVWSNGCPSYGDEVVVNVHTIPTVDAGPDRDLCQNEDPTLLDAQAGGDSTSTYAFEWWPSAGLSNANSEDPFAKPDTTTLYYVQATTVFGCKSSVDSVLVTIKSSPIAEAGPNIVLCMGTSGELDGSFSYNNTHPANPNEVVVTWSPATDISAVNVLDPVVNPTNSMFYTLTVTHGNCTTQDSVLVSIIPDLGIGASADTLVTCEGDSVQLTASSPLQNVGYTWVPSAGLADANSGSTAASPSQTTTYTLYGLQSGCRDTTQITVTVLPTPVPAFVATASEGCVPHTISVQQTTQDGNRYVWDFGDSSPVQNFESGIHVYDRPGEYDLTLTAIAEGGCSASAEVFPVTVHAAPVAAFMSDPAFPVQMTLPNTSVEFKSLADQALSWFWTFGDGTVSDEINPTHVYVAEGSYTVTLTVTSPVGCVSTVSHGPYVVLAPDLFLPNVFSPNGDGISDRFLVEYSGSQPFTLKIMDRWGGVVYASRNKLEGWDGLKNGGGLAPEGVYFYVLQIGSKEYSGNITLVR
jgi:gliding motility-associated-like protein